MHSDVAPPRPEAVFAWAVAVVMLVVSCVLGYLTTYVFLLVIVAITAYLLIRRDVDWRPDPMGAVFLLAFAIYALLYAVTARQPHDAVAVFNFSAFIAYLPVMVMLSRHRHALNALRLAWLAFVGVSLAFALSLVQVYLFGEASAGVFITDRIRLANSAVLLGFIAPAMGIPGGTDRRRWLLLLAVPMAAVVVLLAGARIAMISLPILVLLLAVLLARRKLVGLAAGLALMAGIVAVGLNGMGNARVQSLVAAIVEVAQGGMSSQPSVHARLMLYEAGWSAFQGAPWLGYGWTNMMPVAGELLRPGEERWGALPHLHNDLLSFAVAGGVVGALVYLALLAAPLVIVFRGPRDGQFVSRRNGVVILVTGYLIMGLTDTMIGFETHTAFYVGLLALIFGWCSAPASGPR